MIAGRPKKVFVSEKNILTTRYIESRSPVVLRPRPSCPTQLRTETLTRIVVGVRSDGPTTVPVAAPASPPNTQVLPGKNSFMENPMTKHLRHVSPDFAILKKIFGQSPVLSCENSEAYDAIWARILESIKASDFIEQMLAKDLADATWEMNRYSRHKASAIERKYLEQQELYEDRSGRRRAMRRDRRRRRAGRADRAGRARSAKPAG